MSVEFTRMDESGTDNTSTVGILSTEQDGCTSQRLLVVVSIFTIVVSVIAVIVACVAVANANNRQHPFGGKGLMGGWYDACTGWYKTIARTQVFRFSKSYLKGMPGVFWADKGSGKGEKTNKDLSKVKIGYLDGWASDEKCLTRAGNDSKSGIKYKPPSSQDASKYIFHYASSKMLVKALQDGDVDLAFTGIQDLESYKDKQIEMVAGKKYDCMIDGNAMMTRKDNSFNDYFNAGLNKIMESGQFQRICKKASEDHNTKGVVRCKGG